MRRREEDGRQRLPPKEESPGAGDAEAPGKRLTPHFPSPRGSTPRSTRGAEWKAEGASQRPTNPSSRARKRPAATEPVEACDDRRGHQLWTPPGSRDTEPEPSWTAKADAGKPATFPARDVCLHTLRKRNRRCSNPAAAHVSPRLGGREAADVPSSRPIRRIRKDPEGRPGVRKSSQGVRAGGQGRAPPRERRASGRRNHEEVPSSSFYR
jgi:hypothetical protein